MVWSFNGAPMDVFAKASDIPQVPLVLRLDSRAGWQSLMPGAEPALGRVAVPPKMAFSSVVWNLRAVYSGWFGSSRATRRNKVWRIRSPRNYAAETPPKKKKAIPDRTGGLQVLK